MLEVGISLRVLALLGDVPSHIQEQFQLQGAALMEKLNFGLWSRSPAVFPVTFSVLI